MRFSLKYFLLFLLVHLTYWRPCDIDREQLGNQQHLFHNKQQFTRALSDFHII